VCAANAEHADPVQVLKGFIQLRPLIYHLTDGQLDGRVDAHVRYGHGTYPLREFLSMIPKEARLTNEGARSGGAGLHEAGEDSAFFRALELSTGRYDGLEMRHATPADVDEVYRLNNDPADKPVSFSSAEIPHEQPGNLFVRTIEDPDRLWLVFRIGGTFAGQISLQKSVDTTKALYIDMSVAAAYRVSGYSRKMLHMSLDLVRRLGKADEVIALVRKGNARALRHFRALGFVESVRPSANTASIIQLRLPPGVRERAADSHEA
jgi:ribosomal protein S18 acetylase RimI-like enzyme